MSNVVFSNVHLNFSFDSDSLFSRIQTILYQWAKTDLSNVFDKVFEDRDVDDTDLHLENVDFDLGDIPEGFFLSETCSRLKEKLEQLIYPKIEKQRKSTYLKILLNSCKKIAPEINSSLVEEVFSSVYRAEDSKETIIKKAISILQKNYPDLSLDEMTEDVLNELNFIRSKKKNVYLLNALEKIYFSFFQNLEDTFIQSFLTSTVPNYISDGYLDLLKHFVLEMPEKYPELSDVQNSKNLFFEPSDDKNNVDLKQIFKDICAFVQPNDISTFVEDFIRRTKESAPTITTLGIVILFIDEIKKKYPYLNDFRLSNFDEDKLSDLSKIYWKNEIKEILWNIYKPILQAEADASEEQGISISDEASNKAEDSNAEKSETAESNVVDSNASDIAKSESNDSDSKSSESKVAEKESLERESSSNKKQISETKDTEDPTSEKSKQNQEDASISDDASNKAEDSNAEKSETAESDVDESKPSNSEASESNDSDSKSSESNVAEYESLERESSSDKNQISEAKDPENSTLEESKQNQENASVSDDAPNKTGDSNAEKSETAESDVDESKHSDSDASESNDSESKSSKSKIAENESLERKSSSDKKQFSEAKDTENSTLEESKQNQENASVSDDAPNKAGDSNAFDSLASTHHESEAQENSIQKRSPLANTTQTQTSEAFDKIFNECLAESSAEKSSSPLQVTENFISKLQKEFPDKAAAANAVKAYQKATELEMKYNAAESSNSEIIVKDAGLVLIGAYIPILFKKLEYVVDGAFVSDQARLQACLLLRYIVFGDLPSDGLYFLGNYFCGLPWNFRIPENTVLDENEKTIAESLIKSVIDNWKAIGHVSIDGFRGTFLHRDGKIEKESDEEVCLKVKQGPFDMLLDRLPWSYSMLKFKWHKKLLSTTWR